MAYAKASKASKTSAKEEGRDEDLVGYAKDHIFNVIVQAKGECNKCMGFHQYGAHQSGKKG